MAQEIEKTNNDHLVQSSDPEHPANLIPELCRKFYNWGWVTGTGGGVSSHVSGRERILTRASIDVLDFDPSRRPYFHCTFRSPKGIDSTAQYLCPGVPYS